MTDKERKLYYRVGLFTMVGLVCLGIMIMIYGEDPAWLWSTRWKLAVFVDVPRGIDEGTPTYLQGVLVGRVEAIVLRDPQRPSDGAKIIVQIEDEHSIPADSRARVHPEFGFGKGQIYIIPPLDGREALPKDGTAAIPGKMVGALESIVPEAFIQQLVAAVDSIGKLAADMTADEFSQTLTRAVDNIGDLARRMEVVTNDLHQLLELRTVEMVDDPVQEVPANFYTVVQRFDRTLKSANEILGEEGDRSLRDSLANVREATGDIRAWADQLDARTDRVLAGAEETLSALRAGIQDFSSSTADAMSRMSAVLEDIHRMTQTVNQGKGFLGGLIYDPKAYEALLASLQKLEAMLEDLRLLIVQTRVDGFKIKSF